MLSIETVRINSRGRDHLIRLKTRTGIEHWNILCRWAFCISVSEKSEPRDEQSKPDGKVVEMTWRTFAGEFDEIYMALLKCRCIADSIEATPDNLNSLLHRHIHRGLGYMMSKKDITTGIDGLIKMAV